MTREYAPGAITVDAISDCSYICFSISQHEIIIVSPEPLRLNILTALEDLPGTGLLDLMLDAQPERTIRFDERLRDYLYDRSDHIIGDIAPDYRSDCIIGSRDHEPGWGHLDVERIRPPKVLGRKSSVHRGRPHWRK